MTLVASMLPPARIILTDLLRAGGISVAALAMLLPAYIAKAQLAEERAESTAMVATSPVTRGGQPRAAVELRMAEGFHVNANPASEDFLIATEISLVAADGIVVSEIFYPPAQEFTFEFWDNPLRMWEDSIVAGIVLDIDAKVPLGFHDLEFVVLYQACNGEACFAPAETTYELAIDIVEEGSTTSMLRSPLLSRASFERQ